VEWPEKGAGFLPPPDLETAIEILPDGRRIHCTAPSDRGKKLIPKLNSLCEDVLSDRQLNEKPV
jgi:tRNA threonylcarbamoyladenosine biosynthesis protein TsaE